MLIQIEKRVRRPYIDKAARPPKSTGPGSGIHETRLG
jgi:hypothetical protein